MTTFEENMFMSLTRVWHLPMLAILLLVDSVFAASGPPRPKQSARPKPPEALEMLAAIIKGSDIGPGSGWFHPSQSRYDWKWLVARMDANRDGIITRKEFTGPSPLFNLLDRDGDGELTRADFDWSSRSRLAQQSQLATMLFRRGDSNSDGRLSRTEWKALFEQAAGAKEYLTADDLRALLFPPMRPSGKAPPPGAGMPSRWTLMKGFFQGEIGSIHEGPAIGEKAPTFRLTTHDGTQTISLSDYRGKKPVVLIFGSFT
jgi:hypothetical protein